MILGDNSEPDLLSELAFEERGLDAVTSLDIIWQLLKPQSGQLSYTGNILKVMKTMLVRANQVTSKITLLILV